MSVPLQTTNVSLCLVSAFQFVLLHFIVNIPYNKVLYWVGYFMGREVFVDWKIDRRIVLKQIWDKWSENIWNVFAWCKVGSDHGLLLKKWYTFRICYSGVCLQSGETLYIGVGIYLTWVLICWLVSFHFIAFHLLQIHIITCVTLDLSNYILQNYNVYILCMYSVVKYINITLIKLWKMTNE